MDKETYLSLYDCRKPGPAFDEHFFRNGRDGDSFKCLPNDDGFYSPVYFSIDLTYSSTVDWVFNASFYKERELSGSSHYRSSSEEVGLTGDEWQMVKDILDECFPLDADGEADAAIKLALERNASFNGYTILSADERAVYFRTPAKRKASLSRSNLAIGIKLAHIWLEYIRDFDFVDTNLSVYCKANPSMLFAVLSQIDPTSYDNYDLLNRQFRYRMFLDAIRNNDMDRFNEYLDAANEDSELMYDARVKPMECAAMYDRVYMMRRLMDIGIDPNGGARYNPLGAQAYFDDYPFRSAARNNSENAVRFLLETKRLKPVNIPAVPLEWWQARPDDELIMLADNHAAIPDAFPRCLLESGKNSILMLFLRNGTKFPVDIVREMYASGDNDLRDYVLTNIRDGITLPVDLIVDLYKTGDAPLREAIRSNIASSPLYEDAVLFACQQLGDTAAFEAVLNDGIPGHQTEKFADFFAAGKIWCDILIRHGFDINADSGALLRNAVKDNRIEFTLYLLDNGADPNAQGKFDETPLRIVSYNGSYYEDKCDPAIVIALIEHGADLIHHDSFISRMYPHHFPDNIIACVIDNLAKRGQLNVPDYHGYSFLDKLEGYGFNHAVSDELIQRAIDKGAVNLKMEHKIFD